MDNRPDPANENEGEKELEDAVGEGVALEVLASASGDHGSHSRGEGNAVENEAHKGQGFVELDDGGFARANCLFTCVCHLSSDIL